MNSYNKIDYIGKELEVAQYATNWKKYFARKLKEYIRGDILEVGAGIGANTRYLSEGIDDKITSWTLVEPDKRNASKLERLSLGFNMHIINGTIDNVQSSFFDTIIYIDVLEHIKNSKEEIQKAKNLLKTDGFLIILVPAYYFLYSSFDKNIGHFRRYNKRLLLSEINNSLEKVKLYYLDSFGFFASLGNKLFLRQGDLSIKNIKFWDNYLVQGSKLFDILFFKSFGKSMIGIFKNGLNNITPGNYDK